MMQSFSYQAQLADLGVSLAFNYASLAMSGAFAVVSIAFAAPFAIAASARPLSLPVAPELLSAKASDPYSAYRSDGGHATTLVVMGQMPSPR